MKKRHILTYPVICMVLVLLGSYFRLYPGLHNENARKLRLSRLLVYSNLRKVLDDNIRKEYPGIPDDKRNEIVNKQFRGILKSDASNIERSAREILRGSPDIYGQYLLGADSYYYYYLSKKLAEKGRLSDLYRHGKFLDRYMLAPSGHWRNFELHPFSAVVINKLLRLPLSLACSIVPLLLYALSVMALAYASKCLGTGRHAFFISGIFLALSPVFIQRSSLGWYDTDPYNVIFPLFAFAFLVKSIRKTHGSGTSYVLAMAAVSGAYSLFWQGWLFLPAAIVITLICVSVYGIGGKDGTARKLLMYILLTAAFSSVMITPSGLLRSGGEVLDIFSRFLMIEVNPWPDIFIGVGELKTPSFAKMVHMLGGYVFVSLAAIGLLAALTGKGTKVSRTSGIALSAFTVFFILIAANAERFVLFLVGPAALCAGAGVDTLSSLLDGRYRPLRPEQRHILRDTCMGILYILALIPGFIYGHVSASRQVPVFNRVWQSSLEDIRTGTPENSIITSWWPPGHFIKAVADRRVTFDGATLDRPQAYWVADLFLSEDPREAAGILKMLDLGGNEAVEILMSNGITLPEAVSLLEQVVSLPDDKALEKLGEHLPPVTAMSVFHLTHGKAPPGYCLIYNDMVDNVLGLYFVKNWDFGKAAELANDGLEKVFKRTSVDNISAMWEISGGRPYIGEETYQAFSKGDLLYFPNGVAVDLKAEKAEIKDLEGRISGIPESLIYEERGELVETKFPGRTLKLSVMLIGHDNGTYSCIVAPAGILRSVLFRLYYMGGAGCKDFSLFSEREDPRLNTRILIYRVKE